MSKSPSPTYIRGTANTICTPGTEVHSAGTCESAATDLGLTWLIHAGRPAHHNPHDCDANKGTHNFGSHQRPNQGTHDYDANKGTRNFGSHRRPNQGTRDCGANKGTRDFGSHRRPNQGTRDCGANKGTRDFGSH
eukprot:gene56732-biopygen98798